MAIGNETKILEKQMKLLPVQSTESNWAGMDPKRVIRPPLWQRRKGRGAPVPPQPDGTDFSQEITLFLEEAFCQMCPLGSVHLSNRPF